MRNAIVCMVLALLGTIVAVAMFGCGGGLPKGGAQALITVMGKVVSEDTGEGINEAIVIINGYRTKTMSKGSEAGWFELTVAIQSGVQEIPITVSKHGYQTYAMSWRLPQPIQTPYRLGDIKLLERPESATLIGKVVERGTIKGIGNAMVSLISDGSPVYGWTDANGEFVLSGIPAGLVRIKVEHRDFLTQYAQAALVVGEEKDIGEITLLRLGYPITVVGVVLDAERQTPVKGASVSIAGKETKTNELGRFELPDVPSGEQKIKVTHPDYELLDAKMMIRGDELTLFLMPKGTLPDLPYNISGTVKFKGGQPAKGATVELLDAQTGTTVARTLTDSNGRYWLFVPAGEYIIRVRLDGYKPQEKWITLLYGAILSDVNFELEQL